MHAACVNCGNYQFALDHKVNKNLIVGRGRTFHHFTIARRACQRKYALADGGQHVEVEERAWFVRLMKTAR